MHVRSTVFIWVFRTIGLAILLYDGLDMASVPLVYHDLIGENGTPTGLNHVTWDVVTSCLSDLGTMVATGFILTIMELIYHGYRRSWERVNVKVGDLEIAIEEPLDHPEQDNQQTIRPKE